MAGRYAIGIDFGTESGRAVLVDVANGRELADSVYQYANGVITDRLPGTSVRLGHDWALQDPADYLRTLEKTVPAVVRAAKVKPEQVIGLGVDFTACTMLPVDQAGRPLCFDKKWRTNPHAWVKLWKHHAAQPEADRVNQVARETGQKWLDRYGGRISSEWFFPKALQILDEAPEVYTAAARLMEATDWVVLQMTGVERRNSCTAGYKAIWSKQDGFPPQEYFRALDPRFENVVEEKMSRDIFPLGARAGGLTAEMAARLKLVAGTAVAVANVDAHVAVPACTVTTTGKMVMIMGTSVCHMVCGSEMKNVPGQCGVVEDGILPGLFGFEAGQSAVGDIFAWFVKNCVPGAYEKEARAAGLSLHELLAKKAARLRPGESGVLAIDWWNGNRSVLVDADLTGVFLGLTLATPPEHMYRALLEATAFGTYKIIRNFEQHGVPVEEVYCCGGLPERSPLLMQIWSDVTNRTFRMARSAQTCALGAAMHGAVAAGSQAGGYDSIHDAAARMAGVKKKVYRPDAQAHAVYEKIFAEYDRLHDYFGRGENDVMKRLKAIRLAAVEH
jgi:L-ribulokinase